MAFSATDIQKYIYLYISIHFQHCSYLGAGERARASGSVPVSDRRMRRRRRRRQQQRQQPRSNGSGQQHIVAFTDDVVLQRRALPPMCARARLAMRIMTFSSFEKMRCDSNAEKSENFYERPAAVDRGRGDQFAFRLYSRVQINSSEQQQATASAAQMYPYRYAVPVAVVCITSLVTKLGSDHYIMQQQLRATARGRTKTSFVGFGCATEHMGKVGCKRRVQVQVDTYRVQQTTSCTNVV